MGLVPTQWPMQQPSDRKTMVEIMSTQTDHILYGYRLSHLPEMTGKTYPLDGNTFRGVILYQENTYIIVKEFFSCTSFVSFNPASEVYNRRLRPPPKHINTKQATPHTRSIVLRILQPKPMYPSKSSAPGKGHHQEFTVELDATHEVRRKGHIHFQPLVVYLRSLLHPP